MKKMMMAVLPLILIGGGILGAGMSGMVEIPGITPKKAKAKPKVEEPIAVEEAVSTDEQQPEQPEPPAPEPAAQEEPSKPTSDPDLGIKKIASLWAEIDTPKLQAIVADWKEPELASILRKMDPSKVAELLAGMDSKKASSLSREIQKQSSSL